MLAPVLIFAGTYLVVAIGRLPGFRVDRTGAAIVGAALMIAFNVLSFEEAYAAIDYDTIILLFGMMIVVANLRLSGFFRAVSAQVVEHAHRPILLLAAIVFVSGVFSALFVNDTMCLVLTPLVLEVTSTLRRGPAPFLLAVAMGANIGSVSRIPYAEFMAALAPVALIGLVLAVAVIAAVYWKEFRAEERVSIEHPRVRVNRVLMWKSIAVSLGMMVFFFLGWPVPKVAIVAGALLLVTRRVKPEKIYHDIDWSLLVLFIGLFIVVAGIEKTSLARDLAARASQAGLGRVGVLSALTAVLSNLVSNVPAVLIFKPMVAHLADPRRAWLALAMSSTLAGNLTLLGSVANLIVVQRAHREAPISFWEYFRVGAPLAIATIAIGILLLP